MAMTWYRTGNGRLGFEAVDVDETALVQADTGEVWKIINIAYEGGITVHWKDAAGNDCAFYTSKDEFGSEEFSNLQIQDGSNAWIEIHNDNAAENVVVVDAVVWG
jgi:hypothetical protein